MKKTKQVAIRLPADLWKTLQAAAETEVIDPPKRTGPPGQTAQFIRQLLVEGIKRRGLEITEVKK